MKKNVSLKEKVVVITGASSGIGRATAEAFAKEGANLILASRSDTLLQEIASECENLGGTATAVVTDVTNLASVRYLFETALAFYGTIDIWINNAGVGAIGEFEEIPLEIHEQVIKTNLLGPLYASYFIVPYFKKRREGIMINTNTTSSYVGSPLSVSYSASKFGLRGFSEALRFEMKELKNIHICDVYASFVDSPGLKHAANFMGKEAKPTTPLVSAKKMADVMVKLAKKPRAGIHVGLSDRFARISHSLMPEFTGKMINRFERNYLEEAQEIPNKAGNLFDRSELYEQ